MKIRLLVLLAAVLCLPRVGSAATNDLATSLQKGLFEEEANHNYPAAIQAYQEVIDRFDEERKLGATALFRLSEVYRKQGKTNEANALAQRIVREFSDQSMLAGLSQGYLSASGAEKPSASTSNEASGAGRYSQTDQINDLRVMLKDSPDLIDARAQYGRTPLHTAAVSGRLLVAQFLIENGADINAKETQFFKSTPLSLAAEGGHKSVVDLLLQKGANVAAVNSEGKTALHLAAGKGFRSIVEVLVGHKADVNAKDKNGATPLHWAVANGFKATAEFLLDHGADPNLDCSEVSIGTGSQLKGTPLDIAVLRADQGMLELLLAHKADPNISSRARGEETPLHIAAQNGNENAASALLAAGAKADIGRSDGMTPLDVAAARGHGPIAAVLISKDADVNRRNIGGPYTGWTPLHWGVTSGKEEVVQFLLEKGANVNAQFDRDADNRWPKGSTPLYVATALSQPEMVDLLLEHKADPNLLNDKGLTPIRIAIMDSDAAKRQRLVAALLDHGADVNTRDADNKTILMTSAEMKDKATFDIVLAHKPDVNATTKQGGVSALHFLAFTLDNSGGSKEDVLPMAEELIAAGADVNLRSKGGKTPLKYVRAPVPAMGNGPVAAIPGTGFARLASSTETNPVESRLASLLRQHGALDDLPDFSRIAVTRKGFSSPNPVATRDTNGLNRFSVLEMIAEYYSRPVPAGPGLPFTKDTKGAQLPFPDPAGIRILRPSRDMSGKKQEIPLSLMNETNTFDCTKDQWLEFGDVIEIPEREHPLSASPVGLTLEQSNGLVDCLRRNVKFIIRGRELEVPLSGYIHTGDTYLSQALRLEKVQNLLRTTSDLSRVKVHRPQAGTRKEQQFTINVASFWKGEKPATEDLWLRNGDIIEVQDKLQQAER